MALSSDTVWEVRTGGSDTNGGGFVTGASGTDWSQQDAAQYAVTDGVTAGTTTITSATANFGTDVVGNIVYVAGGTGSVTPGWYQIVSRTNATTIVVDRSTGLTAGTGVTLNVGGAMGTPGGFCVPHVASGVAGMKCWIKAGNYPLSTSTLSVSGGPFLAKAATALVVEGYQTTRGDRTGTKPILDANAQTGITLWKGASSTGATTQVFKNLEADGQDNATIVGFGGGAWFDRFLECTARDCPTGFSGTAPQQFVQCDAHSCATTGFSVVAAVCCEAHSCATGFTGVTTNQWSHCLAASCTTGFSGAFSLVVHHCTADECTTGFSFGASQPGANVVSCLASNCTTGFSVQVTNPLIACAGYDNGTDVSNVNDNNTFTTLSADPYVNKAGGDYRLNDTAGGGADIRGAAVGPMSQTIHADIGALQHADPSGGGTIRNRSILTGGQL